MRPSAEKHLAAGERKRGMDFSKKNIEPQSREEREDFLFESGTPADRAFTGVTIRTKGTALIGSL